MVVMAAVAAVAVGLSRVGGVIISRGVEIASPIMMKKTTMIGIKETSSGSSGVVTQAQRTT